MQTKTVFQTDHLGIYIGPVQADPSPLEEGVWLIPGGCVESKPPVAGDNQVQRWDGKRWQLISSYRGLTAYNTANGEPLVIDRHGDLPPGYTLDQPLDGQVWRDGQWVDDIPAALTRVHQVKVQEINSACESAITGGFWSSALGEPQCRAPAGRSDHTAPLRRERDAEPPTRGGTGALLGVFAVQRFPRAG